MKINLLLASLGIALFSSQGYSQDLISKVPGDARLVITLNSKAFLTNLDADALNTTLLNLGFFDKMLGDNGERTVDKIADLGIDLNSKSYLYAKGADSVQYVGGLFPLSNRKQFESTLPKDAKIEIVNNLSTIYSDDRDLRISWDDHTIYMLGGLSVGGFFDRADIKERYGLLTLDYDNIDVELEEDYDVDNWEGVIDTIVMEGYSEQSITEWQDEDFDEEEYLLIDSVLLQDEYTDDYYLQYDSIYKHNESIKAAVIAEWVNIEFNKILSGSLGTYSAKRMKPLSKNTLISMHVDSLPLLFKSLYADNPYLGYMGYYGAMLGGMANEYQELPYYGLESLDAQVNVVGNALKLSSSVTMNDKTAKQYKQIYRKGVNPKFNKFLDKDILAFLTVNINTEAYLKNIPSMIAQNYSPWLPQYSDFINLGAEIFELLLDEKAIGKVYKGDNLLLLNGVTQAEIKYTDYEYDDDYEYTEVEKTKIETIPQFMWMFTSEDSKIFDRMIQIGVRHNHLNNLDGIYQVVETGRSGIQLYIQIKDAVVFISNDLSKMKEIRSNTVKTKGAPKYVSLAQKNNTAFVFNTKRVPLLLEELDVPVSGSLKGFVEEVNQYGDLTFHSPGVVGNTFQSEISLEFPKTKPNALQYLFDYLNRKYLGLD